jgi:hypothetical protein
VTPFVVFPTAAIAIALHLRFRSRLTGRTKPAAEAVFTGNCKIREHTGDGAFVGRCDFATYNGFCPRHGAVEDYPTLDDREVPVSSRRRPS